MMCWLEDTRPDRSHNHAQFSTSGERLSPGRPAAAARANAAPAAVGIWRRRLQIGPIPAGTPVGLLTNLNPLAEGSNPAMHLEQAGKLVDLLLRMKLDLLKLPSNATDDQARQVLRNLVDPMLGLSKCPDLIVNRGHYFGTGYVEPGQSGSQQEAALSDQDKHALIEFLKTF